MKGIDENMTVHVVLTVKEHEVPKILRALKKGDLGKQELMIDYTHFRATETVSNWILQFNDALSEEVSMKKKLLKDTKEDKSKLIN